MVMECDYGGGHFLEFWPLTGCTVCVGVRQLYCRLLQFVGVGWTSVSIGALIMFLAGLLSWVRQSRVWMLV